MRKSATIESAATIFTNFIDSLLFINAAYILLQRRNAGIGRGAQGAKRMNNELCPPAGASDVMSLQPAVSFCILFLCAKEKVCTLADICRRICNTNFVSGCAFRYVYIFKFVTD